MCTGRTKLLFLNFYLINMNNFRASQWLALSPQSKKSRVWFLGCSNLVLFILFVCSPHVFSGCWFPFHSLKTCCQINWRSCTEIVLCVCVFVCNLQQTGYLFRCLVYSLNVCPSMTCSPKWVVQVQKNRLLQRSHDGWWVGVGSPP